MDVLEKWWAFSLPIVEKWWPIGLLPIGLVAVWWFWWKLPKREVAKLRHSVRDPKDRVDVEDTLRKTIGQALGAIFVLVGAGFALVQFLEQRDTAQKQIAVSQEQVKISQQQVQASHDLLISNQVAKGFEQLANKDSVTMRLGGIYALEGVLNTSEQYRGPVLEALCAFVRDGTKDQKSEGPPATDMQAALTVIGRRKAGPGLIDLSEANLQKANLWAADLSDALLSKVKLNGALLDDANLTYANLGEADLRNAQMMGVTLSDTNLDRAILDGTIFAGEEEKRLSKACGIPASMNFLPQMKMQKCPDSWWKTAYERHQALTRPSSQ